MQRNLFISVVLTTIVIVYLFNIYWEPLIFMVYSSYIILNKDKSIKLGEMLGFSLVLVLLTYAMFARLYGRGPGMLVGAIVFIIAFILCEVLSNSYMQNKKNRKGGNKK
jgi:uncharacterized membrane protein